jgi:hypothetical protein
MRCEALVPEAAPSTSSSLGGCSTANCDGSAVTYARPPLTGTIAVAHAAQGIRLTLRPAVRRPVYFHPLRLLCRHRLYLW